MLMQMPSSLPPKHLMSQSKALETRKCLAPAQIGLNGVTVTPAFVHVEKYGAS
jgi:hypothetical protein